MDSNVAFASITIADSAMACYDVNAETTAGYIVHANDLTDADCNSQLTFEPVDKARTPIHCPAGIRIDASLPWNAFAGMLTWKSHLTNPSSDWITTYRSNCPLWAEYGQVPPS